MAFATTLLITIYSSKAVSALFISANCICSAWSVVMCEPGVSLHLPERRPAAHYWKMLGRLDSCTGSPVCNAMCYDSWFSWAQHLFLFLSSAPPSTAHWNSSILSISHAVALVTIQWITGPSCHKGSKYIAAAPWAQSNPGDHRRRRRPSTARQGSPVV